MGLNTETFGAILAILNPCTTSKGLQVPIYFNLFNADFLIINTAWIYYLTVGIGITYVLYILSKPMSSSYKLTWSILILIFPVFF